MAKVDLSKFDAKIKSLIKEFSSQSNMEKIGEYAAERIKTRTRLGRGVEKDGAQPKPLKKLSQSYRDQRKGKIGFYTVGTGANRIVVPFEPSKKPNLSNATSPTKSNLTFSGQLLDSITVLRKTASSVFLGFKSNRSDGKTNKEIAEFVSKERPFFHLSAPEKNGLKKYIQELLNGIIKKR